MFRHRIKFKTQFLRNMFYTKLLHVICQAVLKKAIEFKEFIHYISTIGAHKFWEA